MTNIFTMPDIGEGMDEGEITTWLVKVGDTVSADQEVAEVQNDKLVQEILSPYAGTVTKLFVEAPATVHVGDPLIEFDGDGSGSAAGSPAADTTGTTGTTNTIGTADATGTTSTTNATAVTADSATDTARNTGQGATSTAQADSGPARGTGPAVAPAAAGTAPQVTSTGRVLAMPSVRHLAHEKGLDLTTVRATGRHGHISLADVTAALRGGPTTSQAAPPASTGTAADSKGTPADSSAPAPVTAGPASPAGGRQPLSTMRKLIAKAMSTQHTTIPSVTNFDQVEVSKLVGHRNQFKSVAAEQGIKLTYLAYVTKALAATARKFPEFNASLDMAAGEVIYHDEVNIGIAVNTDTGLLVPVIHRADAVSILDIARQIADLATAAHAGHLQPAQMKGATITISNIGSARGSWFTPIINGSEVAILGVGSVVKEPVVNPAGEIVVGQDMKLSLTYDHRLIDGVLAQTGLNYLKTLLADPAYMLMEV